MKAKLPSILAGQAWPAAQIREDSPSPLAEDPDEDWRRILDLFPPSDVVWIGNKDRFRA